ncbi:MAG: oxidoreductase [Frankiales bacterium]|nr:oxidoreductase [Frankiales bacterium]
MTSVPQDRPGRLDVGVVGAGRVGAVLGAALLRAGHRVTGAYAVSSASRRRAEDLLPGVPLLPVEEVTAGVDLVLLAVPDDALGGLVEGLVATSALSPGQIVVHTAGRFGIGVLKPAALIGVLPLALHPVMTFAGTPVDINRLAGCVWGVTAPEEILPIAQALVLEMGGEPENVDEDRRPLYHAALSHAANHVVTLLTQSADMLTASGVSNPARMLSPLVNAAVDNALRYGDGGLTGPVVRGDAGTVRAQLAALREGAPEGVAPYIALARSTALRALGTGALDPQTAEDLLDALADRPLP